MTYVCSGDIPAGHVECSFTTDSYAAANRHFERTGHNVDQFQKSRICLPHDPQRCAQCAEAEYR